MKKIFMGLAALSTLSFAAIDLGTAQPTTDTNVFQTGQNGKIVVEGAVTSAVPIIKYVVYSSADGNYDANGDKWNLNDIVIAQTERDSTLSAVPKKVYVKRVNSGNDGVDSLVSEKVTFIVNRDPYFTEWYNFSTGSSSGIIEGQFVQCQPLALLPKATLETIMQTAGVSGSISKWGDMIKNVTNKQFRTYKIAKFNHLKNGELTFTYENSIFFSDNNMDSSDVNKIEAVFATKQAISNVSVSVRIN